MKRTLVVAFVALQILDILSTFHFLNSGRGIEANPIVIALMGLGGPWWWVLKLAVTVGVVAPLLVIGRTRYAAIMVAWYAVVVVNNLVL